MTVNRLRLLGGGVLGLAVGLVLGLSPGASADVLFVAVDAGAQHTCGVKANRQLACWGDNSFGQANPPAGEFSAVSAGEFHTCALRANPDAGTVVCWGDNTHGQATQPGGKFSAISAGSLHTCGVKQDFTVACWGDNTHGQATPPAGTPFRSVSAGGSHTCGVQRLSRGMNPFVCWGDDTFGQATPPGGNFGGLNIPAVTAGGAYTCGVKPDYSVVCWGRNLFREASPPPGAGPAIDISAGGQHSCAMRADARNRINCWGDNSFGQASPPSAGPFSQVSAGLSHTCALELGRVVCWGDNASGQSIPPGDPPLLVGVTAQGCLLCRAGDAVTISLNFRNPGPEARVEVLVVSHFPDGARVERFVDEDLEVILRPGESRLDLSPITIPAGLPTGTYFIEAALLDNFTGLTLGRQVDLVQLVP